MYNPEYTFSDNYRLFNQKIESKVNDLLLRYKNDPESHKRFFNKMGEFCVELDTITTDCSPMFFDNKTKEIEKFLEEELKRSEKIVINEFDLMRRKAILMNEKRQKGVYK